MDGDDKAWLVFISMLVGLIFSVIVGVTVTNVTEHIYAGCACEKSEEEE